MFSFFLPSSFFCFKLIVVATFPLAYFEKLNRLLFGKQWNFLVASLWPFLLLFIVFLWWLRRPCFYCNNRYEICLTMLWSKTSYHLQVRCSLLWWYLLRCSRQQLQESPQTESLHLQQLAVMAVVLPPELAQLPPHEVVQQQRLLHLHCYCKKLL